MSKFNVLDEVILLNGCTNNQLHTTWVVTQALGEWVSLERDTEWGREELTVHEYQCAIKPMWQHALTQEDVTALDYERLIDITIGTSRLHGMCAFETEQRDEQRIREGELFLLRKELFHRLELLGKLKERSDNAWKILNDH